MRTDYTSSNFFRYFSIASFIGILLAAVALTELSRKSAIKTIVELGEHKNTMIAKTALNAVKPSLVEYFAKALIHEKNEPELLAALEVLQEGIQATMRGTSVVRIKVYKPDGRVAYSTKTSQIGKDGSENTAFISAMQGEITSKLIYRGTFNIFDEEGESDNLIQTYIPVYAPRKIKPVGVFELYTDVNPLINDIERTTFQVVIGATAILLILYIFLAWIVHNADKLIKQQQAALLARGNTLELLSARLLTEDEKERKRIAEILHENIAQSLVAIKLHIEAGCSAANSTSSEKSANSHLCMDFAEKILAEVRLAIQKIRAMAMELRPPGLEDIGLLATVSWLCRELASIYPQIHVHEKYDVDEHQIPKPLKIIIFRVLQEVIGTIGKQGVSADVAIRLGIADSSLELVIEGNALAYHSPKQAEALGQCGDISLASIRQRVELSGGTFSMESNQLDGTVYRMAWDI